MFTQVCAICTKKGSSIMGFVISLIVTSIGGLILYLIDNAVVRTPGTLLQKKFKKVQDQNNGKIAGVSLSTIVSNCGLPNAVSTLGNGNTLRQWQATGFHVALVFDENEICLGISSEISV